VTVGSLDYADFVTCGYNVSQLENVMRPNDLNRFAFYMHSPIEPQPVLLWLLTTQRT